MFCSDFCEEVYDAYVDITISKLFVERVLSKSSDEERRKIVLEFAKMHNYDKTLLAKKLLRQYKILVVV